MIKIKIISNNLNDNENYDLKNIEEKYITKKLNKIYDKINNKLSNEINNLNNKKIDISIEFKFR